ncbi:MAG: hypothetical protein PHO08_10460 [Methylococcales bacterium]|nr:hypothetical protein [Methylococcales bacterium]
MMVIFVHIIALGAIMANALAATIKISLFILSCLHYWLTVRRLMAKHYAIKYTEALGWELSKGGDFAPIEILASTVITTRALFLHFKYRSPAQSWKFSHKKLLLVLNDALDDEDYRWLVVKLKTTAIK